MTYAQRMMNERRFAYAEGKAADHAKGQAEGRVQGVKKSILNLKGVLAPEVIAKHSKMPLDQILDILKQEN